MAWFTDDPGEATANGFLTGCVGWAGVVICAVCEVCGGWRRFGGGSGWATLGFGLSFGHPGAGVGGGGGPRPAGATPPSGGAPSCGRGGRRPAACLGGGHIGAC